MALLCALTAAPAWAGYDEATALQGDAGHTGFASGGTVDRPPLTRKWERDLGTSLSYPVIAGGRAFITSYDASGYKTFAMDVETGATLWWRPAPNGGQLAYDDGTLFSLSGEGDLTAIDAATGATRWVRSIMEPFSGTAPIAVDGVVYVYLAWSGGALHALDGDTGEKLWTASKYWSGTPASDGRHVYLGGDYDCSVSAVDRASGATTWNSSWDCYGGSGVMQTDGARVYAPHGKVADTATGKLVETTTGGLAALAGSVGVFRSGGTIYGRDLVTGVGRWSFTGDGNLASPPYVVNGIAYAGSQTGQLFAVDLATGEPVWQTQVVPAPPHAYYDTPSVGAPGMAAGQGVLLVPAGGKLVAYGSAALVPRAGLGLRVTAGPQGPTPRNSASFEFRADGVGFVYECRLDGGAWEPCGSGVSFGGLASGSHIFEVRTAQAGQTISLASRGWAVRTPPSAHATISGGPRGTVNQDWAEFQVSTSPDARILCRLDGRAWESCSGAVSYSGLSHGQHTFEARALDAVGNLEDPPASRTWTVDTRPPDTSITAGPTVAGDTMTVSFAATESGVTFSCEVGSVAREDCTSPATFRSLDDGEYTVRISATDAAGNTDWTPATARFTVAGEGPNTRLDSGTPSLTRSSTARFTFSSPNATASYECRWDAGPWAACSSPATRSGLTEDGHTFAVRAVDGEGRRDATPAEASWTVDTRAPNVFIDESAPAGQGAWRVSFAADEVGATFRCQLDYEPWASCSSPTTYAGLAPGSHELRVVAIDEAGNESQTPAVATFVVAGTESGATNAPSAAAPWSGGEEAPAPARADAPAAAVPATFSSAVGAVLANTGTATLSRQKAIAVRQSAPAAGRIAVVLSAGKVRIASGRAAYARAATRTVRVKLTAKGRKLLRKGRRVEVRVAVTFTPAAGGEPVRSVVRVTVRGGR